MMTMIVFEPHDSYVFVCLGKTLNDNFPCSVILLVIAMHRVSMCQYMCQQCQDVPIHVSAVPGCANTCDSSARMCQYMCQQCQDVPMHESAGPETTKRVSTQQCSMNNRKDFPVI